MAEELTGSQRALLSLSTAPDGMDATSPLLPDLCNTYMRSSLVESGAFSLPLMERITSPDFFRGIKDDSRSEFLSAIGSILSDFGNDQRPGPNYADRLLSSIVVFNLVQLTRQFRNGEAGKILADLQRREGVTGLKVAAFVASKTLESAEQLNTAMGGFGPTARAEARLLEQFRSALPDDQCRLANHVLKAVLMKQGNDPTPLLCTPDMMFEFVKAAAGWKSSERTDFLNSAQEACNTHFHLITPALIRNVSAQRAILESDAGSHGPLLDAHERFLNIFRCRASVTGLDPVLYTCSSNLVTAFNDLGQALQQGGGGPAVGKTVKQAPISARLALCS